MLWKKDENSHVKTVQRVTYVVLKYKYVVLVYAPKADNDNKYIRKENDL